MHSKGFRVLAAGAALAMSATLLAGCEAKPGVAAYGDDFVITEQQFAATADQITSVYQVDSNGLGTFKASVLLEMIKLQNGASKVLNQCPQLKDLKPEAFKLPQDLKLSATSKEILQLEMCNAMSNPQNAINAGVQPVPQEVVEKLTEMDNALMQAVKSGAVKFSPRILPVVNSMFGM